MAIWIYGLKCPVADVIRYVGKSTKPQARFNSHIGAALRAEYNHHTARWIRRLNVDGLRPELVLLCEVPIGKRWQDVERAFIANADANGWRLTNSTAGGEGLDYINPDDEARYKANLSAALKKLWSTPERREEASRRSLKAWADPEITTRRMASKRVASAKPEVKARVSAASRKSGAIPRVKAAKSAAMKLQWQREDYRHIVTQARNEPVFLATQSARLVARWQDKDSRDEMQALRWNEAKRAEQAKLIVSPDRAEKIAASLTPEVIKRRNASIKAAWARRKVAA